MMGNNLTKLQTRKEILNIIYKSPGLHLREISRRLDIPISTLNYHIKHLKKHEFIITKLEGKYRRHYASKKLSIKDKEILSFLREKTPCKIILCFYSYVACSQIELAKELNMHPTTIEFHLKKLLKAGIIEPATIEKGMVRRVKENTFMDRKPVNNEIIYRLKSVEIAFNVYRLLITQKSSLPDQDIVNTIISSITDLKLDMKKSILPKRIRSAEDRIDDLIEVFLDIFPSPFVI
jgi:DNA-binding MarR family transcriptional regulator